LRDVVVHALGLGNDNDESEVHFVGPFTHTLSDFDNFTR
jgi:hypothetical protein